MNTFIKKEEIQKNESINFSDILDVIKDKYIKIIIFTAVVTSAFTAVAFILPPYYASKVLFAPVSPPFSQQASSSSAGGLGAIAKLTGISVGGESSDTALNSALLNSNTMKRDFIQKYNLLPVLFADKWDRQKNAWKDEYKDHPPSLESGVQFLNQKVFLISPSVSEGLYTLSVEWTDPQTASKWANDYIAFANQDIRRKAVSVANKRIAYLSQQYETEKNINIREIISQLLTREMKTLALANSDEEYAFKLIDGAVPAEMKSKPKRMMIMILGILTGFMASLTYFLIRKAYGNKNA